MKLLALASTLALFAFPVFAQEAADPVGPTPSQRQLIEDAVRTIQQGLKPFACPKHHQTTQGCDLSLQPYDMLPLLIAAEPKNWT